MDAAKILRTAQSYVPALKPIKDGMYRHARRALRRPHEGDFRVLAGLRREPHEVLVDVGANHGQTIESMRLFQPRATVVAFEANPDLAARLARRYAGRRDVRIEPCGLSDAAGRFTLHVPSYRGFVYDGLASLDRSAAASWLGPHTIHGFDRAKLTIADHACRVERLDDFELAAAFIKIDVQGLEHAVLKGAAQTIERQRPAVLLEDIDTDPRIAGLMASLGYGIFHVSDGVVTAGLGPGPNTLLLPRDRPRFAIEPRR